MELNQKLIIFLRNMGIITHYKTLKDRNDNIKYIYHLSRNLTDEEASFLKHNGIHISNIITHKGLHIFYQINNRIRTGKNHPFIIDDNFENMTDCFDPTKKHSTVDNNNLYNICRDEYMLRGCTEYNNSDACKWLRNRILTIKLHNPQVYDYIITRNLYPIPPHYSSKVIRRSRRSRRSRNISNNL